jgi:hypothetical protein
MITRIVSKDITEQDDGIMVVTDNYFFERTYGFHLEIPDGHILYDTNNESIFWAGPASQVWEEGFFIRAIEDIDIRETEIKAEASNVVEDRMEIAVGNINAYKLVVNLEVGETVTHYLVPAYNSTAVDIWFSSDNKTSEQAILDSFFLAEIVR